MSVSHHWTPSEAKPSVASCGICQWPEVTGCDWLVSLPQPFWKHGLPLHHSTLHLVKQFGAQMEISFLSIAFPYSLALGTHPRQDRALMPCSAVLPGGAGDVGGKSPNCSYCLCAPSGPGSQHRPRISVPGPLPCRPSSLHDSSRRQPSY